MKDFQDILLTILDSIDADIYVADMATYEILFMNKHMQVSFGRDLTREICWKVFRDEAQPCAHCTNDQLIDRQGQPANLVSWEGQNPITGKWYINLDRAIHWIDGRLVRIQIATDITERKRVEKTLHDSEERYRRVSQLTSDFAYAYKVDPDGNLVLAWATGAIAQITGLSEAEVNALDSWESIIHPKDKSILTSHYGALLAGQEKTSEYRILDKQGEVRWLRDFARPEHDEGEDRVTNIYGAIQDITEQVRAEEEIRQQLQVQIMLRTATSAMASTLDIGLVLNHIADTIGQAMGATSAYINSYDPATLVAVVLAEYIGPRANTKEKTSDLGTAYPEVGNEEFLEVMFSGQHSDAHCDDADLTEYEEFEMEEYGVKSILYIPLLIRSDLIGYAEIWDTEKRRDFASDEIAFCHNLAQQAAIAIENARLYEQAQKELAERVLAEEELAQHRDRLEELVEQRTNELHKQMEEQKKILELMVGREIRMKELKKVIKRLSEQVVDAGLEPAAHDPLLGSRGE